MLPLFYFAVECRNNSLNYFYTSNTVFFGNPYTMEAS